MSWEAQAPAPAAQPSVLPSEPDRKVPAPAKAVAERKKKKQTLKIRIIRSSRKLRFTEFVTRNNRQVKAITDNRKAIGRQLRKILENDLALSRPKRKRWKNIRDLKIGEGNRPFRLYFRMLEDQVVITGIFHHDEMELAGGTADQILTEAGDWTPQALTKQLVSEEMGRKFLLTKLHARIEPLVSKPSTPRSEVRGKEKKDNDFAAMFPKDPADIRIFKTQEDESPLAKALADRFAKVLNTAVRRYDSISEAEKNDLKKIAHSLYPDDTTGWEVMMDHASLALAAKRYDEFQLLLESINQRIGLKGYIVDLGEELSWLGSIRFTAIPVIGILPHQIEDNYFPVWLLGEKSKSGANFYKTHASIPETLAQTREWYQILTGKSKRHAGIIAAKPLVDKQWANLIAEPESVVTQNIFEANLVRLISEEVLHRFHHIKGVARGRHNEQEWITHLGIIAGGHGVYNSLSILLGNLGYDTAVKVADYRDLYEDGLLGAPIALVELANLAGVKEAESFLKKLESVLIPGRIDDEGAREQVIDTLTQSVKFPSRPEEWAQAFIKRGSIAIAKDAEMIYRRRTGLNLPAGSLSMIEAQVREFIRQVLQPNQFLSRSEARLAGERLGSTPGTHQPVRAEVRLAQSGLSDPQSLKPIASRAEVRENKLGVDRKTPSSQPPTRNTKGDSHVESGRGKADINNVLPIDDLRKNILKFQLKKLDSADPIEGSKTLAELESMLGRTGLDRDQTRSELRSDDKERTARETSPPELSRYEQAKKGIHPAIQGHPEGAEQLAFMYHLRDLFTPLSLHVADRVRSVLNEKFRQVVERGSQVFPFLISQELYRIPFKEQVVDPFPEDFRSLRSIDVYEKNAFYKFIQNLQPENISHLPPRRILQFYKRLRDSYLSKFAHDEDVLHLLHWSALAQANADNGKWIMQGLHALVTKQVENFYWSPTGLKSGKFSPIVENGSVPIGAYGPTFSMNLLIAIRVLLNLAEEMGWRMAAEIHQGNRDLIENATARGRDIASVFQSQGSIEDSNWMVSGPLLALLEGIISISDAIWLLMAEKIHGIEEPSEALRFIVSKGLPARFSLISKTGLVGLFRFRGRYIPKLLRYSEGGVSFAPEVRALKSKMGMHPDIGQTKAGCPAGYACGKDMSSGIQSLSEVLLQIYEKVASDDSIRDKLATGDRETLSKKQGSPSASDEDLVPIRLYQPETADQRKRIDSDKSRFADEFGPWSPGRAWEVNVKLQLGLAQWVTEIAPSFDEVDILPLIQMWFHHPETGEEFIKRLRESKDSNPDFIIEKMSWSHDYLLPAAVSQESQKIRLRLEKLYESFNKSGDMDALSSKLAEIDAKLSRLTQWDILNRYDASYALQLSFVVQQSGVEDGHVIDIADDFAEFQHRIEDYGKKRVEPIVPYHQIKRSWYVVGSDYKAFRIQGAVKVAKFLTRAEEEQLISKDQIPWIKGRFISILMYWYLYDNPLIKERRRRLEMPIIQHTIDDILASLDPKSRKTEYTKKLAQHVAKWPNDEMFPTIQREDGTYQIDWRSLVPVEQVKDTAQKDRKLDLRSEVRQFGDWVKEVEQVIENGTIEIAGPRAKYDPQAAVELRPLPKGLKTLEGMRTYLNIVKDGRFLVQADAMEERGQTNDTDDNYKQWANAILTWQVINGFYEQYWKGRPGGVLISSGLDAVAPETWINRDGIEARINIPNPELAYVYWLVTHRMPERTNEEVRGHIVELMNGDVQVRTQVSLALYITDRSEAEVARVVLPALFNALGDEEPFVRGNAVLALVQRPLNNAEAMVIAIAVLVPALGDEDSYVRVAAGHALGRILLDNAKVAASAVLPALFNTLEDEDLYVRKATADVLGGIGINRQDAQNLIREQAATHEDEAVRNQLGRILHDIESSRSEVRGKGDEKLRDKSYDSSKPIPELTVANNSKVRTIFAGQGNEDLKGEKMQDRTVSEYVSSGDQSNMQEQTGVPSRLKMSKQLQPFSSSFPGVFGGLDAQAMAKTTTTPAATASFKAFGSGANKTETKRAPHRISAILNNDLATKSLRYGSNMNVKVSNTAAAVNKNNHIINDKKLLIQSAVQIKDSEGVRVMNDELSIPSEHLNALRLNELVEVVLGRQRMEPVHAQEMAGFVRSEVRRMGLSRFAETFRKAAIEKINESSAGVNEWTVQAVQYLTKHWSELLSTEGEKDETFTLGLYLIGGDDPLTVESFVEALLREGVPGGLKRIIATGNPKAIVPFQKQIEKAELTLATVRNPDQVKGFDSYIPILSKNAKNSSRNPDVVNVGVDSGMMNPESWNPVLGVGESGSQVALALMLLRRIPDLKSVSRAEVRTLLKQISNQLFPGLEGEEILKWEIKDSSAGGLQLSLNINRSGFMQYVTDLATQLKARAEIRKAA